MYVYIYIYIFIYLYFIHIHIHIRHAHTSVQVHVLLLQRAGSVIDRGIDDGIVLYSLFTHASLSSPACTKMKDPKSRCHSARECRRDCSSPHGDMQGMETAQRHF